MHFNLDPGTDIQTTSSYQTATGTTVIPSYTLGNATLAAIMGVAVKAAAVSGGWEPAAQIVS